MLLYPIFCGPISPFCFPFFRVKAMWYFYTKSLHVKKRNSFLHVKDLIGLSFPVLMY